VASEATAVAVDSAAVAVDTSKKPSEATRKRVCKSTHSCWSRSSRSCCAKRANLALAVQLVASEATVDSVVEHHRRAMAHPSNNTDPRNSSSSLLASSESSLRTLSPPSRSLNSDSNRSRSQAAALQEVSVRAVIHQAHHHSEESHHQSTHQAAHMASHLHQHAQATHMAPLSKYTNTHTCIHSAKS
jgi:hypothetical protein